MFILHRIVFVLNVFAILALLASYLAPFITPELSWQIAFLGLAYPAILAINVLFIMYWAIFLKLKFMFSLAAIIIGSNYIPRFIQFEAKKSPQSQTNCIQVISFNTRYFGLLDNIKTQEEDEFFDKVNKINPDIFCLEEFYNGAHLTASITDRFEKKFKNYYRANISVTKGKWATDNMGILCRYPIVKHGTVEHDPTSGNYTIYADIALNADTLRIICTHLQSIGFERKQYKAVEMLQNQIDSIELSEYKKIASKMKLAFLMRAKQADAIKEFIEASHYKIILCGDFNDSPTSYAYRTIKGSMKDAFMEAGSGLGRTYVGAMPSLRIDYILGDPSFEFFNYYSKSFDFSDHKMVSCSIKIK